jgi:hypothetical protein
MYVRKKKVSPFISGARCQGFGKAEDIFPVKPPPQVEPYRLVTGFGENLIDAETGKPISVTKASWNAQEGRIDLDTSTILAMGTGRLDIKARVHQLTDGDVDPAHTSKPCTPNLEPLYPIFELPRSGLHSRASNPEISTSKPSTARLSRQPTAEPPHFLFSSAPNARQASWNGTLITESRAVTAEPMSQTWTPLGTVPSTPNGTAVNIFGRSPNRVRISSPQQDCTSPLSLFSGAVIADNSSPTTHKRHPLISEFLKSGPRTPMMHINWDPLSNTVVNVDEDGNPIEVAEEGVEYSSDDCSDAGEGNGVYYSATSSVTSNASSSQPGSKLGSLSGFINSANNSVARSRRSRKRGGSVSTHHSSASNSAASKRSGRSRKPDPNRDTTLGIVDESIGTWSCFSAFILHHSFARFSCPVNMFYSSVLGFPPRCCTSPYHRVL